MTTLYYKPSGKLSASAFALALAAVPILFGLAWLYAWLTFHIPLVYVNGLILLGYALIAGAIIATLAGGVGKVRNPMVMTVLGIVLGGCAWYAQWAWWLSMAGQSGRFPALAGQGVFDLLREPQTIRAAMALLYEYGFWTFGKLGRNGATLSGAWLGIVWFIEFAAIVGLAVFCGRMKANEPFSEKNQTWAEQKKLTLMFPYVADAAAFRTEVEQQPLRLSEWLDARSDDAGRYAEVTLYLCNDGINDYLSISNVEKTIEKGKEKTQRATVLEYLKVAVALTQPLLESDAAVQPGTAESPEPAADAA